MLIINWGRLLVSDDPHQRVCGGCKRVKSQTDSRLQRRIGYGSSAVVYQAIYIPLRRHVAIKLIDLDQFERNQIEELRVRNPICSRNY